MFNATVIVIIVIIVALSLRHGSFHRLDQLH
jgi:hypothetical protein